MVEKRVVVSEPWEQARAALAEGAARRQDRVGHRRRRRKLLGEEVGTLARAGVSGYV